MSAETVTWPWRSPLGSVDVRPVEPESDLDLLHAWMTHPRSFYWGMQGWSHAQVATELREIDANPHHHGWIVSIDGQPVAVTETYDPEHSPLRGTYRSEPGDLGMHVLVAPPRVPRSGTTDVVMTAVMCWCFRHRDTQRVVVEPDVRNDAIHAKNAAAGIQVVGTIDLPDKTASLGIATRADFRGSPLVARFRPSWSAEVDA